MTEAEKREQQIYRSAWEHGYSDGEHQGYKRAEWEIESERRREAEQKAKAEEEARNFRTEIDGDQIVEVDGYAYRWPGKEPTLSVGDRVLLPENWFSRDEYGPGPFEGVVDRIGSSYQGSMSRILRKIG